MGVTEGVPLGVVDADVVSLSSLKFPLGILNFCTARKTKTVKKKKKSQAPICSTVSVNLLNSFNLPTCVWPAQKHKQCCFVSPVTLFVSLLFYDLLLICQ